MTAAFARGTAWTCNLCTAEGRSHVLVLSDDEEGMRLMQQHTEAEHPDHIALLASGAEYRPQFPTDLDSMAGEA